MISLLFFNLLTSSASLVLGWASSLVTYFFPEDVNNIFASIGSLYGGIYILNKFLPIQELLIFSGIGIALNFVFFTAYFTMGAWAFVRNIVFFWR